MNKHDVEYRMYSLKNFCEIFDELFSYNTGDDFWKRCVCEATIRDLNVDICDTEVEQCPEEISLREALKDVALRRLEPYKDLKPKTIDTNKINEMLVSTIKIFMDDEDMKVEDMNRETLHYLCGCFRFRLSKLCPFAYSADYSEFMKMVKKQGIENYINKVVALYTLVEQYQKY